MNRYLKKIEEVYNNSTLLGCAMLSLSYIILSAINSELALKISSYLIPLFICILCIELYIIKSKLTEISRRNNEQIMSFELGEDFDNYLAKRFKDIKELKMILASANGVQSDPEPKKKFYISSLHKYINSGNPFYRIFTSNSNPKLYQDVREEMMKFKDKKHFVYYYDKTEVIAGRYQFVLILDNEEVCFGGGYNTPFNPNSISIKEKMVVKWYMDYFDSMKNQSKSLRRENNTPNFDLLDNIIKSKFEIKG